MLTSQITEKEFLDFFPKYSYVSEILLNNSFPFAIFAGSEVWLLTNSRVPTDLDILVRNEDLIKIADLFNHEIKIKQKEGVSAKYILIDNVEIVSNIAIIKESNQIDISLNDLMLSKLLTLDLDDDLNLPLLAPEDTIILKALLKRGESEGKFDIQDIESLKSSITIDMNYLKQRAIELNAIKYVSSIL